MQQKKCGKCNLTKDVSLFHKRSTGFQSVCIECRKSLDADRYITSNKKIKNRDKVLRTKEKINKYKRQVGCHYCDERETCCLQFHHINDNKEFDISSGCNSKSWSKLLEEITKCIVVCANCHFKLHAGLIGNSFNGRTTGFEPVNGLGSIPPFPTYG